MLVGSGQPAAVQLRFGAGLRSRQTIAVGPGLQNVPLALASGDTAVEDLWLLGVRFVFERRPPRSWTAS